MTAGVPSSWKTPLWPSRPGRPAIDARRLHLRLLWTVAAERIMELAGHLLAEGIDVAFQSKCSQSLVLRATAGNRRGQPGADQERSRVRCPLRHKPPAGILRQDHPPPPQPRRRPSSQRSAPPHRPDPDEQRTTHQGLHPETNQRRQKHQGSHPVPQTCHRPRGLPPPDQPTRPPARQPRTYARPGSNAPSHSKPSPTTSESNPPGSQKSNAENSTTPP
jgi:hypothetical protein